MKVTSLTNCEAELFQPVPAETNMDNFTLDPMLSNVSVRLDKVC